MSKTERIKTEDLEPELCIWVDEFDEYAHIRSVNITMNGSYMVTFDVVRFGKETTVTLKLDKRRVFDVL
jgi:hypothetical protein